MSCPDSASAEAARDALELLLHEQRDARQLRAMAAATSELEAAKEAAIERESGARNSSSFTKLARPTTTKGAQMFADYEAKTLKRVRELKRSKYLIDPRTSKLMPNWDVVTSIALIFTAIMTPVEVGFMDIPADRWADGLFITNRCVDIIFIFDSILQCFIMCASRSCRTPWRHGRCCCHAVPPPLLPSPPDTTLLAKHPASLAITCNHSPWCHLPRKHPVPWCATCRAGTRIRLGANPASRAPMVSTG